VSAVDQGSRLQIRKEQGFEVYILGNERIELAVVPELGARMISLKNLRTGREWMWHPPGGPKLFRNRRGDDFSRGPLVGMDECLPTIAPCSWQGRALPDHGEVWSVPWDVDETAWAAGELRTKVRLAISPFEFERGIELRGHEVWLNYRLSNLGPEEESYLWAMHPLLRLVAGDQLQLPASTRAQLDGEEWIEAVDSVPPAGQCVKVFARPVQVGWAGIYNRVGGDHLELGWDPQENDTLGLWLTRGGWHGHHHLALEPTNAAHDALALAAEGGRCGVVAAGGSVTWDIRVRLGP
jgi:hypothetical protein